MSGDELEVVSIGTAIRRYEFHRGYLLHEGDVVVLGSTDEGVIGPQATIVAADLDDDDTMAQYVAAAASMFPPEHQNLVVVGKDVDDTFHDEIAEQLNRRHLEAGIVKRYTVAGEDLWGSGTGRRDPENQKGEPFVHAQRMPDVAAEMITEGHMAPAATREEYLQRFDPAEESGFQPLAQESGRAPRWLEEVSPVERTQAARRLLRAAARERGPADAEQADRHQLLAHLVSTDLMVRDSVAIEASGDDAATERLTQIYRASPAAQRPQMASCAAVAHMFRGRSLMAAKRMLDHAAEDRGAYQVGRVAHMAITTSHAKPEEIRQIMDSALREALEEREREWRAAQGPAESGYQPPLPGPETDGPEVG